MGWVFVEVAVALAIAIGTVWWKLPRKPKPGKDGGTGKDEPPRG